MLRFKSFECYCCHRGIQEIKDSSTLIYSTSCGHIKCLKCLLGDKAYETCPGSVKAYNGKHHRMDRWLCEYLRVISTAPAEELKLLHFCKWSPLRCIFCKHPIVDKSQLRNSTISTILTKEGPMLLCARCCPWFFESNRTLDKVCGNILLEVKSMFSNTVSEPIKPTPLELYYFCTDCKCKEKFTSHLPYFHSSGESICRSCARTSGACGNLEKCNFDPVYWFICYVPDPSDLKLLTYSKWVDLRCSSCRVHFSTEEDRLPMFHTTGCNTLVCKKCSFGHEETCLKRDKNWSVSAMLFRRRSNMILLKFLVRFIRELRGYFKDPGIDNVPVSPVELRRGGQGFVSDVPSSSNNELGRGGQGVVRKEAMAVKEFSCGDDAALKRMAFREVEILKKLQHPNIVKYYDSNWDEDRNTMTVKMEMCGRNLRHYIGYLISREVQVSWSNDLLSALLYMKEQRVHHRDIKPENILTVPTGPLRGSLKLCDFGLAKVWFTGAQTENQWCTKPYQDPVVSLDSNNHCFESDLYSAGITLWEVVNRKHAYQFTHEITDGGSPLVQLIYKCTEPLQSGRISVENAYAEIDIIKKRDIGNTAVNFDEVFNVRREACLVEDALEDSDGPLQLSLSSS